MTLNVGVARKRGLPGYGSVGASCHLEPELPEALLHSDPDAFRPRVRAAYLTCARAVADERARHEPTPDRDRPGPNPPRQLDALAALARRHRTDLGDLLRDGPDVARPEDLTRAAARRLIDRLRHAAAG